MPKQQLTPKQAESLRLLQSSIPVVHSDLRKAKLLTPRDDSRFFEFYALLQKVGERCLNNTTKKGGNQHACPIHL